MLISNYNKNRIKILSSKGNDNKEISKRTGLTEKTIYKVLNPKKMLQLFNSKRPIKTIIKSKISKRPKSRVEMLHEYIEDTDIVWKDDLYKIGVAHITKSLRHYERHNNVKFIEIDDKSWEVVR